MENKQIGILTFHDADNYGAVLQAYALQHFIEKNVSSDVEIIDYRKESISNGFSLFKGSTHSPVKNLVLNVLHLFQRRELKAIHDKFESFRNEYLKLTSQRFATEEQLAHCDTKDYFITGSDQVFNPRLPDYRAYYLGLLSGGGIKLAYAPSFGISTFNDEITNKILPLLKDFQAISCREKSGADYLSMILGVDVPVVLDPVFLLAEEEWKEVMISPKEANRKYLLVYCLSKGQSGKIRKLAKTIAKIENLEVITIGSTGKFSIGGSKVVGPCEFVGYLNQAEFVLTDSFHGTSFSLLFGKRHLSYIANKDKGTRIEAIMKSFGKGSEIIYDIDSYRYKTGEILPPRRQPVEELAASKRFLHNHLNG